MGLIQAVVTIFGVFGIIGLLFVLFWHYLPGWTWMRSYIFNSTREEKMTLTKPGHYNQNGCMIPSSDSDLNLSGRGSFRRFDKTDHDYSLLRQGSVTSLQSRQSGNIPPQPLRPAPVPPYVVGPLISQGSLDSVFNTAPSSPSPFMQSQTSNPNIPLTKGTPVNPRNPQGDCGGGSSAGVLLSNNNPFLPLIQASTQFFSQKFQSFQPQQNGSNDSSKNVGSNLSKGPTNFVSNASYGRESYQSSVESEDESFSSTTNSLTSTSTLPNSAGLSMGEILFSSPPAHSITDMQLTICQEVKHDLSEGMQKNSEEISKEKFVELLGSVKDNVNHSVCSDQNENRKKVKELQERSHKTLVEGNNLVSNFNTVTSSGETIIYKPGEHQTSPSPTRLRDRQRKMEFTLQHLQNNQEDRFISKKYYNPDACYPVSSSTILKGDSGNSGNPIGNEVGGNNGTSRFRSSRNSVLHTVPTLAEADEQAEMGLSSTTKYTETFALKTTFQEAVKKEEKDEMKSKSILETMREEIRIENERMADATKSLMMEENFSISTNGMTSTKTYSTNNSFPGPSVNYSFKKQNSEESRRETTQNGKLQRVPSAEDESKYGKKISQPPRFNYSTKEDANSNFTGSANLNRSSLVQDQPGVLNNINVDDPSQNSIASGNKGNLDDRGIQGNFGPPISSPPVVTPFRNTRSFSLRQSSTDSVGSEGSDVGSPDGNLPSLQRAMSCDSVSSDTSIICGDLEPPHVTGHLCVGLEYDSETADLLVNVIEAKELVGPDPCSKTPFDSYVRVYLLPDKTTNMQTRVYRKSVNPVYREKFMFGLETMELPLRTLVFYLYGTDKYSNTLIGEAELKLGDLDILQPTTTWLQLTDTGQRGGESGEIMFSLSYLPTAERLTVVVVKARNLKFPLERETGDPFVKVYLLQKGKKVSKKKSSTKRAEKNPIFNEAMIFSVPAHALQTIQLRITVANSSETEGRAYSIGHVIVGSSTAGKSLSHWNQMLSSLRKPIAMWHPLRK